MGWVWAFLMAGQTLLEADAASDAKDYDRCAALFTAASALQQGDPAADSLFFAGRCLAQGGKSDDALSTLERSVAAGLHSRYRVEYDDDLSALHPDPRWPKLLAAVQARFDTYEQTLGKPALHRELLEMFQRDQLSRREGAVSAFKDAKAMAKIEELDRTHALRMNEIVAAQGFPNRMQVGVDGVWSAWLLVQHADKDLALQKRCLPAVEQRMKDGEIKPKAYAYLVDRVAVGEKRPQVYGTQFNEKHETQPIEDEAHVNDRRKSVGLPPLKPAAAR